MTDAWSSEAPSEFTRYSQRENLTDRLRGILDDYPPGLGPWKEFLQNADDASARHFTVVVDFADHREDPGRLFSDALRDFQASTGGPKGQQSTPLWARKGLKSHFERARNLSNRLRCQSISLFERVRNHLVQLSFKIII